TTVTGPVTVVDNGMPAEPRNSMTRTLPNSAPLEPTWTIQGLVTWVTANPPGTLATTVPRGTLLLAARVIHGLVTCVTPKSMSVEPICTSTVLPMFTGSGTSTVTVLLTLTMGTPAIEAVTVGCPMTDATTVP